MLEQLEQSAEGRVEEKLLGLNKGGGRGVGRKGVRKKKGLKRHVLGKQACTR